MTPRFEARVRAALPITVLAASLCAAPALAQVGNEQQLGRRPAERPLELPDFAAPEPGRVLPRVVLPDTPDREGLAGGVEVRVDGFAFSGNTALSEEELQEIAAPYRGRDVSHADLEALRLALTQAYVDAGYINSGALIPDQTLADGTVRVEIVEGRLDAVQVATEGRLPTGPIRARLARLDTPLRLEELEEALQVLQKDPRIQRLDARLSPGDERGLANLDVQIVEATPWSARLEGANDEPGAVGQWTGRLEAVHRNVLGFADTLAASGGVSEGLREVAGTYAIPLGSYGTWLEPTARYSDLAIVKPPFDVLDLESEAWTLGVALRQKVYESVLDRIDFTLGGEVRYAETTLDGTPITLTPGPIDGESKLALVRAAQEWTRQGADRVIAARSTFTLGIDAFDATTHGSHSTPDGEFFAWLGQLQVAQRLPWQGLQLIGRVDTQLSNDPLLGLERFQLGGRTSVRGYPEKVLVTDNGVVGSLELRIPLWSQATRGHSVALGLFSDAGRGWNKRRVPDPEDQDLWSAGVALRVRAFEHLYLEASWAEDLEDVPQPLSSKLQREGFYFYASLAFP